MPVLVVSHGFQSNYERGFCNALAARAWAVTLVSSDRTDYVGLRPEVQALNLRGSQDESRPRLLKLWNMLRYHAALVRLVWARRQSGVVHVIGLTQPPLLCGVLEGLWYRLVGGRYVLTVHDLLPHDRHSRWQRALHRLTYRLPQRLVVHTRRMARELEAAFGVEPARIVVMEHGIEPLAQARLPAAPAAAGGPLRLLFFGHVMRYKGIDVLLAALKGLAGEVELVVSGRCIDAQLSRELRTLIAQHPHAHRITWHDAFVPESQMEELFRQADAVVLPYRHIDQSGVLFQALRWGTPVVATRAGSLADYVTPDVGELCDPGSADDLRAAIERLAARRTQFSRARIQAWARRFEWTQTVAVLDAAYIGAVTA